MAGCNCTKESYLISYEDTVQTIQSQHSDWSSSQIRREAAFKFRPQYRQNAESVKKELSGKGEYGGTDFSFDSATGVSFHNGYDTVGLIELHERQLKLTPDKYSFEEHATSLLINEAFRLGANRVVTSYPNVSGQRDIIEMSLDRQTGKGKTRIINTQVDHSNSEIRLISKNAFSSLSENSSGKAFIFSDKPLSEKMVKQTVEIVHHAGRQTIKEVGHTVRLVQRYIETRKVEGNKIKQERVTPLVIKQEKRGIFEIIKEKIENTFQDVKASRFIERIRIAMPIKLLIKKEILVVQRAKKLVEAVRRNSSEKIHSVTNIIIETYKRIIKYFFVSKEKNIRQMAIHETVMKRVMKSKEQIIKQIKIAREIFTRILFKKIDIKMVFLKLRIFLRSDIYKKLEKKHSPIFMRILKYINKSKNVFTQEYKKNKQLYELKANKPRSWLLLTIIRYLTMKREGDGQRVQPKKQMKRSIPPQGVIFAYAT